MSYSTISPCRPHAGWFGDCGESEYHTKLANFEFFNDFFDLGVLRCVRVFFSTLVTGRRDEPRSTVVEPRSSMRLQPRGIAPFLLRGENYKHVHSSIDLCLSEVLYMVCGCLTPIKSPSSRPVTASMVYTARWRTGTRPSC